MEDEILFSCELCGSSFPADPNTMLECEANFRVVDTETNQPVDISDCRFDEIMNEAKKDPELRPFLKGAICVCLACQDKMCSEAEKEIEEEI